MDIVSPVNGEDECAKCARRVWISVSSDKFDFDAPCQKSECIDAECPINAGYKPGPIQLVEIAFVQ